MKKIYLAAAVLILFPILSGAYLVYTEKGCRELVSSVERAAENAEGEEAQDYLKETEEKWRKMEKRLAISANHTVIEEINESFTKAKAWCELEEKNMYIAEMKWLSKLIRHVYEMERPRAYNIF